MLWVTCYVIVLLNFTDMLIATRTLWCGPLLETSESWLNYDTSAQANGGGMIESKKVNGTEKRNCLALECVDTVMVFALTCT
jgi:hypothetical protein